MSTVTAVTLTRRRHPFEDEINPRFPAWVYAATAAGMNLPAQWLRCALDLPPAPPGDYAAGKLMVRYSYDMVTEMTPFHNMAARGEHP